MRESSNSGKVKKYAALNRDLSFSMNHHEVELSRMQDKCKAYENEVARLRSIHSIEVNKLKLRVTVLEKVLRSADSMASVLCELVHD